MIRSARVNRASGGSFYAPMERNQPEGLSPAYWAFIRHARGGLPAVAIHASRRGNGSC